MTLFTDARCREPDVDPDVFFPVGKSGPALRQREVAFTYCDECPVVAACLERALGMGIADGIAGGADFAPERAHLPRSARALTAAA